jgi:arsenate reductase-like glutaredoxin family protein
LYVNPEEVVNKNHVVSKLSKIIPILEARVEHLIRKRDKRYVKLLSKLSIESSEKIEKYISDERDALKR